VKNPDELEVRKRYVVMHRGKPFGTVLVVRAINRTTGWFEADEIFDADYSHRDKFSMADKGMVPYSNGVWNAWNYLIPEESLKTVESNISEGMKSLFG